MLFADERIAADFMGLNEIEQYLMQKLQETLGFKYHIITRLHIGRNWFNLTIDETHMNPESYTTLTRFMHKNGLAGDLEILNYFLNEDSGGGYKFEYLVTNLSGVYIIRNKKEV